MMYVGAFFLALGLTMWTRGMIYTLYPRGKIAEKRKRKNLKYGFTTDMKVFGRKVRRLGFLVAIIGGVTVAWLRIEEAPVGVDPASITAAPSAPDSAAAEGAAAPPEQTPQP